MSYVVPSVLVYQQLANAGGVANVTPDLDSCIIGPCYNVVKYDSTTTGTLLASFAGKIEDNSVNNLFSLPSSKVGQVLESSSVVVYVNRASVETLKTVFDTTSAGANTLQVKSVSDSGDITAGSHTVSNLTDVTQFVVGDPIRVVGAGASGADLITTVADIDATTLSLTSAAGTTVTGAAVTKEGISVTNPVTSTAKAESGDTVVLSYTVGGVAKTFSSTIKSVTALDNVLDEIALSDILPADITANVVGSVRKTYNNQHLLKSIDGYTNFDDSDTSTTGQITIRPEPKLAYGVIVSAEVHVQYRALRRDLAGRILAVTANTLESEVGDVSEENPLALGLQIALANTTTQVLAITIDSDDLEGYQIALELAENCKMYCLTPLTQDVSILMMFKNHVEQMSTPEEASWRIALANTAIPIRNYIGQYNENSVNDNGGNNFIGTLNGQYILTASNATFMADGVVPGDLVNLTAGTPSMAGKVLQVKEVLNNQQLLVDGTTQATGVAYFITRKLTKAQQAQAVAAATRTFGSNRVSHVQPDIVGVTIKGVTRYVPGYYLCCAYAGLVCGFPVQQGFTNIAVAGIAGLQHSNFYFTRAQLGLMAQDGTCLFVQESQGSAPYCRHELTTDMTVLQYRELQQVKNWDYLSYFFVQIIKGFIGKWNITPDSLQVLRQTITAGGKLLQGKVLPKIGPPLLDFKIAELKQDPNNKDHVVAKIPCAIGTPMNYCDIFLII